MCDDFTQIPETLALPRGLCFLCGALSECVSQTLEWEKSGARLEALVKSAAYYYAFNECVEGVGQWEGPEPNRKEHSDPVGSAMT